MNSRILITMLCGGAIAIACTARSHNESAAQTLKSAPHERGQQLAASFNVVPDGKAMQFALRVVNTSKKNLELDFPNGQAYDFVVVDSLGREVWRWGNGRMFTQAVQNKFVGSGESFEVSEHWQNPRRGKYTAIAMLTSTNYPVRERVDFTLR
ncbi:MAG TPA: BsuPI-related putative proteinase inhibitor [Gemmatimonadaceae bacterium]|jgi:hypothetical protein|nr:BsuPI-related putative proteinase inhibitor [Gemmatimonadaceae bacterium]